MPNAAHVRPWSKMDQKTKTLKTDIELSLAEQKLILIASGFYGYFLRVYGDFGDLWG